MKLIIKKNYEEISEEAAKIIKEEINNKKIKALGLATGSTPIGVYKELIKEYEQGKIDFSEIKTFNLDEYYPITKEDKQSYHYFMHQNFFNKINLKKENINMLNGMAKNPVEECKKYEEKLGENNNRLQILGIGTNGHIAFNEPGSSFNSKTRKVELSQNTIKDNSRFFENEEDVPTFALTMGLQSIMNSEKIILIATGKAKAKAVKELVEGKINRACPATILRKHKKVIVILDEEAASLLVQSAIPSTINGYKILTQEHLPKNKKIIVVSPHPDDSCINPGGTICKLSSLNDIDILVMTTGHRAKINGKEKEERIKIREEEVKKECEILEATPHFCRLRFYDDETKIDQDIKEITNILKEIKPDIIMIPHKNDAHSTHIISRKIVLEAIKNVVEKIELWSYETTWSLFKNKKFNMIVVLSGYEMQRKIDAIKCHESQIKRTRYDLAAKALGSFRAALIPEQALTTYGEEGMELDKYIELLNVETLQEALE